MKCHIAADLLPLYAEHLTSAETDAELAAHLAECADCAARFAAVQEQNQPAIAAPEDIRPLKTVRNRGRRTVLIVVAVELLAVCLFYCFCLRGTLLRSDQIQMHISTYWDLYDAANPGKKLSRFYNREEAEAAVKSGASGTLYERVSIELDGKCLSMRTAINTGRMAVKSDTPPYYQTEVVETSLYSILLPPIGNPTIWHKSLWSKMSWHTTATESGSILICCKDGNFAYDTQSLAALADASPDGTAHLTVGEKIA